MEEKMLENMVQKIALTGANVVMCQKGIDDIAQHFFAKKGIFAIRRVKKSDMEKLAKATGGKIVSNIDDLTVADLGKSRLVEEVQIGNEKMSFVKGCPNAKSVTILVRGSTEQVVNEAERAIKDALGDLIAALQDGKVVSGAGSVEIGISKKLMQYAETFSGREKFAIKSFAQALEIIPITLAENGGLDPIDVLTELSYAHDNNKEFAGIDVFTGKVIDAWQSGIIEPSKVKMIAISSATEVATMILRIDDVIASKPDSSSKNKEPHEMMQM